MQKPILLSWSSGKDSAWALQVLRQQGETDVAGIFTTVNQAFERVAMHSTRKVLLLAQAESIGLPLHIVGIPNPCTDDEYRLRMKDFLSGLPGQGIQAVAYGDLYLEAVRDYRLGLHEGTGVAPLFPLWGLNTKMLSREMLANGLKARLTCIDPKKMPASLAGCEYDEAFLQQLPEDVDPCGEAGEFHSFAYDGPCFKHPVSVTSGETVTRDGFTFTDLLPV